ncbi:MAG: amino acid ABC transporter permease [Candidatus Paracaedibacteraceae bacterium]|nr:amino acid ABC transporter permease [Candidatus Paracaedibacteraceae bacterium]
MDAGLNFSAILPSLPYIFAGVLVTLKFTLISISCGLPLGVLLAILKVGTIRPLRIFANAYTSVFRGTPLLVQLMLIYTAVPHLTQYRITAFEAGIITFSLNSAAYASEVIRGGIQSIDIGQWEAGHALGLSRFQTFYHIIMPLAVRNILPNLVNEFINLLKESALVSIIGEADLLFRAKAVAAEKFMYFEPFIIAASIYYVMVLIISCFGKRLEKSLSYA